MLNSTERLGQDDYTTIAYYNAYNLIKFNKQIWFVTFLIQLNPSETMTAVVSHIYVLSENCFNAIEN